MQLEALAQSGFDPLSRTWRFMLTEEARHMFVGETTVTRIIQRACEAMKEAGIEDPHGIEAVSSKATTSGGRLSSMHPPD
jgi:benzoyl-CoA 2,3-dioxygenase component B